MASYLHGDLFSSLLSRSHDFNENGSKYYRISLKNLAQKGHMLPAIRIVLLLLYSCVAFRTWIISSRTHTAVPERAAYTHSYWPGLSIPSMSALILLHNCHTL